jgi:hypothetical protein
MPIETTAVYRDSSQRSLEIGANDGGLVAERLDTVAIGQAAPFAAAAITAALVLAMTGCEPAAQAPVATKPPVETRKTIGKTTQNVLLLEKALADGGVLAETAITSSGLEMASDAYKTSVGKIAGMAVQQKLNLYQAEHGEVPESYDDFMARIIEPGSPTGLQLPMLPYYQEYAYDPAAKKLVVVEFPAKKEQRQKETTGAAGI